MSSPDNPYRWAEPADSDLEPWQRHLADFVPKEAFDAHAHLWQRADLGDPTPSLAATGPEQVGLSVYRERMALWMPERVPTGGLFFPFPTRRLNLDSANQFLAEALREEASCRGLRVLSPREDPAGVEADVLRVGFAGFKVYHLFADRTDSFLAETGEFLPEWAWELAEAHGLAIMLHLVLPKALAEPRNQEYLRTHCRRYPRAKLILAHAGRGFCGRHTVAGVASLRGLDNLYFDTSAVCEPAAFEAILQHFGPTRLLYGSDFCVSEMRSRCVNLGDGFLWLDEIGADYRRARSGQPTLLGIESLLALKQACHTLRLDASDVEEIFCLAGRRLFDLPLPRVLPDGQEVYRQAKRIIPGGTQLLSKRPEMFAPERWPAYYREARGCEVIDIEGRKFLDMSLGGILSTILGYADPEVNDAVMRRVSLGNMSTLQTGDEVELASELIEIHPWAEQVRFTRGGGESMAVAVRLARAATGRDRLAVCGYHGWHDWYLAANRSGTDGLGSHLLPGLEPAGVPTALAGSVQTFHYNRLDELDAILATGAREFAAIVMETTRHQDPEPGFLEGVRERCDRYGIRLLFDEISCAWRLCLGGAHLKFGVTPDLAIFAKALGNGFPIGAVLGRRETMEAAQHSFVSSTFWTEGVGPAAGLACVRKMRRLDVPAHLARIGGLVMEGWERLGGSHGLPVRVGGRPEMALLSFAHPDSDALLTWMTTRMLKRGFLAGGGFNAMWAHEEAHVTAYLNALDEVFAELATVLASGELSSRLGSPVKHRGFARLT